LSIPDEGYSRNVSYPLNLISPFSLDIRIHFEIPQMLIEPIVFLCDFFAGGLMSYLRYLWLLAHSGVQNILCVCVLLLCKFPSCVHYVASFSTEMFMLNLLWHANKPATFKRFKWMMSLWPLNCKINNISEATRYVVFITERFGVHFRYLVSIFCFLCSVLFKEFKVIKYIVFFLLRIECIQMIKEFKLISVPWFSCIRVESIRRYRAKQCIIALRDQVWRYLCVLKSFINYDKTN
jgi:hypothetical protein